MSSALVEWRGYLGKVVADYGDVGGAVGEALKVRFVSTEIVVPKDQVVPVPVLSECHRRLLRYCLRCQETAGETNWPVPGYLCEEFGLPCFPAPWLGPVMSLSPLQAELYTLRQGGSQSDLVDLLEDLERAGRWRLE